MPENLSLHLQAQDKNQLIAPRKLYDKSGDMKICQVKRKFIFIQILNGEGIPGSLTIVAKNAKPQSEEEHELYIQILDSICANFDKHPINLWRPTW